MTMFHRLEYDLESTLHAFEDALVATGFRGDIETGIGSRHVGATDNSIYEVLPAAIVYPREAQDIGRAIRAINAVGGGLSITARGGNTGTNGQSLNTGIILDVARHLNRILDIDVARGCVTVEPGVVLDQLNAELSRHGLFFPPTVSTASRATIGGMVGTDASGKGSRVYGKTSDYIEALDVILSDGSGWRCIPMSREEAEKIAAQDGLVADIHREALRIVSDNADEIAAVFPDMNRGLTGYNLQKTYDSEKDRFSLSSLLAGSEGTLAVTSSIKLRVARKPTRRALAVLQYEDFQIALSDVERLLETEPVAVEIIDDKVLGVATTDIIWSDVENLIGNAGGRKVNALNFVEYAGFSDDELQMGLDRLYAVGGSAPVQLIDIIVVRDQEAIAHLWTLRERCVGLLARIGGSKQGIAFIEDTAVPPAHLADYVHDFRNILDSYGLEYGMFGHADVGCLHVRPFLDLKDPDQAALIRLISDQVASLTKQYGGLLWGEHGRGFRGEYTPFFFGPKLYDELRRLKGIFDPDNILNPGKLVSPRGSENVDRIDRVQLRGEQDRLITSELMAEFDRAVACNGNGACFSWDALDAMCPSYKATRDRAQSPKGRAALLKAWARQESAEQRSVDPEWKDIEEATKNSLSTCLSCKACTTHCPVKVDIPAMKSRFLSRYYSRRRRPLRDHVLARTETMFAIGRRVPKAMNLILGNKSIAGLRLVGIHRELMTAAAR